MKQRDGHLTFSATDLAAFSGCGQRTLLDREVALGTRAKPRKYDDPALEALSHLGDEHEARWLRELEAEGRSVARIDTTGDFGHAFYLTKSEETLAQMRSGVDIIHQGVLYDGTWGGLVDVLMRVETPSDLGAWSYEVVDAKLARSAKPRAIVQVCLYSELLAAVQGAVPQHIHLYLGRKVDPLDTRELAHYAAYSRDLKRRFLDQVEGAPAEIPVAPDPVEMCGICRWRGHCTTEREAADHLSRVAGLARGQLGILRDDGTATMRALSSRALEAPPEDLTPRTYTRLREQARLQVAGEDAGEPRWEFLDLEELRGLQALPEHCDGDWFFDFEGAPYALENGLEYLWGISTVDDRYTGDWALTRADERTALQNFLTSATEALEADEGFHIYHFGHYETTALKKLVARYGVGVDELDRLLIRGVFVDLHRIFVQAIRASVPSYSLKKLEEVIGFTREMDLDAANRERAELETAMTLGEFGDPVTERKDAVQAYNRDDCLATRALRDWLEARRSEHERVHTVQLARFKPREEEPRTDDQSDEVRETMARLLDGLPDDSDEFSEDERVRHLAAHLLEWHRREDKQAWWTFFHWRDELSDEELLDENQPLAGLEFQEVGEAVTKQSNSFRLSFPDQDFKLSEGKKAVAFLRDESDPDNTPSFEILAIDELAGTIDIKATRAREDEVRRIHTLVPEPVVGNSAQRARLLDVGKALVGGFVGFAATHPMADALLRARPPQLDGQLATVAADASVLDRAIAHARALQSGVLAVQGPPGTGKTHAGARMITALLAQGLRVGVTANSHKVITNLVEAVCTAATEGGIRLEGVQACGHGEEVACADDRIRVEETSGKAAAVILDGADPANLFAGTAWLWSREDLRNSVDVLVVDEAGQFALANTVAISHAAPRMILLGDPQQLKQPLKGFHPDGLERSVLEHLMDGADVIHEDMGLFLGETWRMRPEITGFTSELFYRGKLVSRAETERQSITLNGRSVTPGLRLELVEHAHNGRTSTQEAGRVVELCRHYLRGASFTGREGPPAPLTPSDLRVVAPYNAQVKTIRDALAGAGLTDIEVGTVDKFQGQEAPVAIYSLTSSSAEDAPRGMSFLYALDRLNVATSRAKVVTHLIASPRAFEAECRSPEQLRQLNAFLRFREMVGEG